MLKKIFIATLCASITSCMNYSNLNNAQNSPKNSAVQYNPNDPDSEYRAGMRYLLGRGVPQNYSEAKSLFERAADQGNSYAESELGYMYISGKGVTQDLQTSFQWYQKAADHGLASAQYNLGLMYAHGVGTLINKDQARIYFQKALTHGFTPASHALATL